MLKIFIDIETVPVQNEEIQQKIYDSVKPPKSMKKEETIKKWEEEKKDDAALEKILKTGLNGAFGETMVIGFAIEDQEPKAFYRDSLESSEADLLRKWFDFMDEEIIKLTGVKDTAVQLIGHNIINFDNRFLFNRCVVLKVKPPLWFLRCVEASPFGDENYDTMLKWAGNRGSVSLSTLIDALGLMAKGEEIDEEIDGSQVWSFIEAGKVEEVVNYCIGDVQRVKDLYARMNFL